MNQTDSRKPSCQISLFIVKLHANTAVEDFTDANAEAWLWFLLYISTQINNYPSEKFLSHFHNIAKKLCF